MELQEKELEKEKSVHENWLKGVQELYMTKRSTGVRD